MVKNITLSADEIIIKKARQRAKQQNTTLNAEFRKWLKRYTRENSKVLSDLSHKYGKSKLRIVDECLLCAVRRPLSLFFGTP